MPLRVEQLAAQAQVSVDTVRFYQAKGLLPPPRREGRVAWYDDEHVARLARIRHLQGRGLTLATIKRLVAGELDTADEALVTAVADQSSPDMGPAISPAGAHAAADAPAAEPPGLLTLEQLAARSGIPLPLLQAVEREGLLIPHRTGLGELRYTHDDLIVAQAGLRLLEFGLPLPEILELARRHHRAMREVAERAVQLFDDHVRQPLRSTGLADEEAAARLVDAFANLLPATTTLVAHHFRRTLLAVAQEHIEHVGVEAELDAVHAEVDGVFGSPG